MLDQRHAGLRILTNVEGFILRESDRDGVFKRLACCRFAVDRQHTGASLAEARCLRLESEGERFSSRALA